MCKKPKFGLDSVFKNQTIQKFDISSDGLPTETTRNPPFRYKRILALNVQINKILKHDQKRVLHIDFTTQLHHLLIIVVNDVSDIKVTSSAVAVIFAVN